MKIELRPVMVFWDDICSEHGWKEFDEFHRQALACKSLGWLFYKDKKVTMIVQSLYDDDFIFPQAAEAMCFPNSVIKKIIYLDDKKHRKNTRRRTKRNN